VFDSQPEIFDGVCWRRAGNAAVTIHRVAIVLRVERLGHCTCTEKILHTLQLKWGMDGLPHPQRLFSFDPRHLYFYHHLRWWFQIIGANRSSTWSSHTGGWTETILHQLHPKRGTRAPRDCFQPSTPLFLLLFVVGPSGNLALHGSWVSEPPTYSRVLEDRVDITRSVLSLQQRLQTCSAPIFAFVYQKAACLVGEWAEAIGVGQQTAYSFMPDQKSHQKLLQ